MEELYHQMTLMEWVSSKNRIRKMIRQAKASFVVIGYELRKIEESRAEIASTRYADTAG